MSTSEALIEGCLLGTVLADAAGARFEGMERPQLQQQYDSPAAALKYALSLKMQYTDDGQMTLAVADYLSRHSEIVPEELMQQFVEVYQPWRGYGRGTRVLVDAFRDGVEYEFLANTLFPGGSHGNGAAMRSAPVGLRFAGDSRHILQQAKRSAWPTHRNILGIEGAQLIALASAAATQQRDITPRILAEQLHPHCTTLTFQKKLRLLHAVTVASDVEQLGNGIEAHESVVTALACFALNPDDFLSAVGLAIWQGGDTDTIAAMTGALCGARLGVSGIPQEPLERLEDGQPFREHVHALATAFASACKPDASGSQADSRA